MNLFSIIALEEIECAKNQVHFMNTPVSTDVIKILFLCMIFFIIIYHFFNFKDCPKECDYMVFKTSVNSAKYPTDYYAGMLLAQSKVIAKFSHDFFFVPYDKDEDNYTKTEEV